MRSLLYLTAALVYLLPGVVAISVSRTDSAKRAQTTLTDGTQNKRLQGKVGTVVWQSTGILIDGCPSNISIKDCYTLQLSNDPTKMLDPNPTSARQRIEFSIGKTKDNIPKSYTWKHYLSSKTGTGKSFFHLMQVISDGYSGPVITLDAEAGKVAIKDMKGFHPCPSSGCPSVALEDFTDRVTLHSMNVTFGNNGKLAYKVIDEKTGKTLIDYSVNKNMGNVTSSIKFGTYRGAYKGMTESLAYVGDWTGEDN